MLKATFSVLGGDLRQSYLAAYLCNLGQEVTAFAVPALPDSLSYCPYPAINLREALAGARLVVCPIPLSRDDESLAVTEPEPAAFGKNQPPAAAKQGHGLSLKELLDEMSPGQVLVGGAFPESFALACHQKQISTVDLLQDEDFLRANAALTAEGLLAVLLRNTPFSLTGRKTLLLGYGRCGQEIARLLTAFSMKLWVLEKDEALLSQALTRGHPAFASPKHEEDAALGLSEPESPMDFDFVINTVPARVLSPALLAQLPARCRLFDIASAPFGFDSETARTLGLSYVRCPGLPGRWMPQTAGEMMGKTILERMLSYGF